VGRGLLLVALPSGVGAAHHDPEGRRIPSAELNAMAKTKSEVTFDRCKSINPLVVGKQRCGLERGHAGVHRSTEVIDEWQPEEEEGKSAMVYLGGSKDTFRCDVRQGGGICGCNVFTRLPESDYRCNSCGMIYEAC
jgi:hypothetical protein